MDIAEKSRAMVAARLFAVTTTVAVGMAAFWLSFATLRDLAILAHIPASDAWLFPMIVDGTIIEATVGALVLANSPERQWFRRVLVIGAMVSIAGNSLHAVAAGKSLPPWACALVAAIAPLSLLADTHGLALLFRAAQRVSAPVAEAVVEEPIESDPVSVDTVEPAASPAPAPTPQPLPVPARAPAAAKPLRPALPLQTMLPISVPVGGA